MARIMLSIQSVQFTTLLTFLLALTTIAHASLPFQQSPPPPGDLPNQPDPQATMPTPTSFVLFAPTSSSSAASTQHNASRPQDGANQATPAPGSGPGPGHAVGHETIIGSLAASPTTLGNAPSAVKSGSIGLSTSPSMSTSMHMQPSKTGELQAGMGSRTAGKFGVMSWVAFGLWVLDLIH